MTNLHKRMHLTINKMRDNILERFSFGFKLAYLWPFSPLRGTTWKIMDKSSRTILDIGPFWGAVGRLFQLRNRKNVQIIGIDINEKYIEHCKCLNVYDSLIVGDGRSLPFRSNIIDVTIALEVIEHLEKEDGYGFLGELERVKKRQTILSTPIGFRALYDYHSESQIHRSGWYPIEFKQRGYKVRGTYGIRLFPKDIAYWISYILPLDFYFPIIAYNMLCFKNDNEKY